MLAMAMTLTEKPTILVVEDDEDMARLIRLVLEYEGFQVRHIADGLEALAYIASQPAPALMTLDIELPHAKGDEVMMLLKTAPGWERVPVVMITATAKKDSAWAVRRGAKGHLLKPFQPQQLLDCVRKLLKGKA
jgi:two-component system, OmpR family, alkaline phosphatase synthesis response regulator PhoP